MRLAVKTWTKKNGLPSMPQANISDLCHHLWSEHTQQITNHITKSSINQLQSTFDGAIFHCEDKHASSLRIYCPCLYYQSIESTFQDPSIFEQLPDEPSSIVSSLVESLHRQHGKAYPWAPSGYILAKRKKDFRSGRPIISFVESPFRPMLNILARLIFQLIPSACPHHFATGDVYTLLSILREAPVDADLILVNQDLAGFFTSIDQDRFVRSWFMLLDFLRPKMNVSDDEAFSVYPGKSYNPGDIIKGRTFRRLNVTRKIVIKHVPELIKSALNMQTFALGKRCVRQSRGSPMGSPLSPALCLMVVSISEQIWSSTFHHPEVPFLRVLSTKWPFQLDNPLWKSQSENLIFPYVHLLVVFIKFADSTQLGCRRQQAIFLGHRSASYICTCFLSKIYLNTRLKV